MQAIHTRPVQSGNTQNMADFTAYMAKYGLCAEIRMHGFVPAKKNTPFIDREHFLSVKRLVKLVGDKILHELQRGESYPLGLSGLTGVAIFFVHYYRFTEKRIFLDYALDLTGRIAENAGAIKNDFTLATGLPGFGWFIEYLAQHSYIENSADEIMSEVYEYYDKCGYPYLKEYTKNWNYSEFFGKNSLIRSDLDLETVKRMVSDSSDPGLAGLAGIGLDLISTVNTNEII